MLAGNITLNSAYIQCIVLCIYRIVDYNIISSYLYLTVHILLGHLQPENIDILTAILVATAAAESVNLPEVEFQADAYRKLLQ